VTPEKIAKSDVLMRALNALRNEGRLARVVVDEAHCVSQVCRVLHTVLKTAAYMSCFVLYQLGVLCQVL
jgi:hypothetical protein